MIVAGLHLQVRVHFRVLLLPKAVLALTETYVCARLADGNVDTVQSRCDGGEGGLLDQGLGWSVGCCSTKCQH